MGFAFKEIDPHTYFPTRKTALAVRLLSLYY